MNPDPLEDADGPNYYLYVKNNPLHYVDPDGRFAFLLLVPIGMSFYLSLGVLALLSLQVLRCKQLQAHLQVPR